MGGRLSTPRGPAGTTEAKNLPAPPSGAPRGAPPRRRRPLNQRRYIAPFAALALGSIFYVYSRTSIQSAKDSAKRRREADGGSISWRNEGLRRHGALEKPEERPIIQQLFGFKEDDAAKERREKEARRLEMLGKARGERNPIEEGIRRAREGKGHPGRDGE